MAMGVANPGKGLLYMSFYVLGFAVPFLIMTSFIDKMTFLKKHGNRFMVFGGILMIGMGILLYFDWMRVIISKYRTLRMTCINVLTITVNSCVIAVHI